MSDATVRRTDDHNLRQAISDILEQTYAIEYSMGLFYRKGNQRDLERAQESLEIMRAAVERLGRIIAGDHLDDGAESKIVEAAE
jgi:hypothetical protein